MDEADYVAKNAELDARFTASVKAIGDGIDHLKRVNAALYDALSDMLTASQPQHTFKHIFMNEAQEKARAALSLARSGRDGNE